MAVTKYWIRTTEQIGTSTYEFFIEVLDQYGNSVVFPGTLDFDVNYVNSSSIVIDTCPIHLWYDSTKTFAGPGTTHDHISEGFFYVNGIWSPDADLDGVPIDHYNGEDFETPEVTSEIEINTAPDDYPSAHGDLLFVVYEPTKTSDALAYPGYKYICDIYIGETLVTRLKKLPQPDNSRGVFNIGGIIRSYVSAIFNPGAGLRAQQFGLNEYFINATLKFGEEYDNTIYTNQLIDSERSYYNHYNGRLIGESTILPNYLDKALTNRPYQTSIDDNSSYCFIPFLPTDTDSITLSIKAYRESGLKGTITQSFSPSAAKIVQLFNIAPSVINTASAGFIDDTVKYYTVEFQTPNGSPDSIYRFDLTCEAIYEVETLHFLNKLGSFESKNFSKVSRKTSQVSKSEFGKLPFSINGSGGVDYYTGQVYNESRSVYAASFNEKLTLNTDILTDDEYEWLSELVYSPLIYIERGGYFLPVVISQNNYEFRKRVNDKLSNLTIDIEFGDRFNTQYR